MNQICLYYAGDNRRNPPWRINREALVCKERMARNCQANVVSFILFLVGTSSCKHSLPLVATADSPSKTYQMQLKGNPNAPAFFLSLENEMRLDVHKSGKAYLSNIKLDSYDSMDADWNTLHPDYVWVDDSLLRFGWHKDFSDADPSFISVRNETGQSLKYILVEARDIWVLLDLAPHTCVILKSAHQGELGWVAAKGQFEDGTPLTVRYSNFYHQDKVAKPLQYCITVKDQELQIGSPTLTNKQGLKQPGCFCEGLLPKQSLSTNDGI